MQFEGMPMLNISSGANQNQIVKNWIKNSGEHWSMLTPQEQLRRAMAWDARQKASRVSANVAPQADVANAPSNIDVTGDDDDSGGGSSAPKLDQTRIDSLLAMLGRYDTDRAQAHTAATVKRDTAYNEKETERNKERVKYDTNKLTTLQDFGTAKTATDINTRDTLDNLRSSLATLGMGGSRELTRQILSAANRSNRQANATQARTNKELDGAWNEYEGGYQDDRQKIADQYSYDVGQADKDWAQNRQNTYYQVADVYGDANRTGDRSNYTKQGDALNDVITNATFLNPSYTGKAREMATPELADYSQDIAQYTTTGIGGQPGQPGTPAGNVAVRAIAVNDKDLGVKKRNEGGDTYGV